MATGVLCLTLSIGAGAQTQAQRQQREALKQRAEENKHVSVSEEQQQKLKASVAKKVLNASKASNSETSTSSGSRPSSDGSKSNGTSSDKATASRPSGGVSSSSSSSGTAARHPSSASQSQNSSSRGGIKEVKPGDKPEKRKITNAEGIRNLFDSQEILNIENGTSLTRGLPDAPSLPGKIVSDGTIYLLKTKMVSVDQKSEEIIYDEYPSSIFPGALVYCDQELANGSPSLVHLDRGECTVTMANLINKGYTTRTYVPSFSTTHDAMSEMITEMFKADVRPSISLLDKATAYTSTNKMSLDLGVDASFLGNKANVKFEKSSSSTNIISVINFTQSYYTLTLDEVTDVSTYFAENVTPSMINDAIKKRGPIGIITSVTYGRRAYFFREYKTSSSKFSAQESAKIMGQKVSSSQEIADEMTSTNSWVYIGASEAEQSGRVLLNMTDEGFRSELASNLTLVRGQAAVPIAYTVKYLGSGNKCTTKVTGEYTETEYRAVPKSVHIKIYCKCSTNCSDNVKVQFYYNTMKIDENGNCSRVIIPSKQSDYNRFGGYRYDSCTMSHNTEKSFELPIPNGEYIDGKVHVYVMSKTTVGADYMDKQNGWMDPMDPNGEPGVIDFRIYGEAVKGRTYVHSSSINQFGSRE